MLKKTIILLCLLTSLSAQAHHPSHSGANASGSLFFKNGQTKPQSLVFVTNEFRFLDNSVGQLNTTSFGGEWAVSRKVSLLGQLPLSYLSHNFRSNKLGLGDIQIGGKYAFSLESPLLFSSLNLSLPTGDSANGLGQNHVSSNVAFFAGLPIHNWIPYVSPGISVALSSSSEPILDLSTGLLSPKFFNEKLSFGLALNNQIYLDPTTFTQGSFKMALEPQINWTFGKDKKLTFSQSAKITLVDQLKLQNGISLTGSSHTLLSDSLWGAITTLNYTFK